MEKTIATRLLTETLQNPFDEAKFRQFVRNLVNDLDESKAFTVQGNYIKDAYKQQVRQYKRIGQYVDPDGNTIDILVVRLHQSMSLDRARTMQRNFIAQYLHDRGEKEAALVAYTTDESTDWRFSLVRLDYRLEQQPDGSYKPKKEVTAARRSSFLVGETEPNHTAQQQLLPLLLNDRQNPTLDQLEAAFNIESVTKEFFERYKTLFLRVRDEVETLRQKDSIIAADFHQKQIDSANFAKKLLGQIVFLYFLQKKGWLGVEPGKTWGSGAKDFLRRLFDRGLLQLETVQYDNFFNDVLEPLFYDALAIDRGSEALYELPGCQQPCKIPFLNGGLFEPIGGYDWQATNVLIANETIATVFDTFDLYNFTVREDEPLDKEVAVDPEMLGKVFENLLEVNDRKSKGAFYTPREIVHYMCQESLINYLETTINRRSVELLPPQTQQISLLETPQTRQLPLTQEEYWERVPRKDLEHLIRQGERAIENDTQVVQKGTETPTYQFQISESVRIHAAAIDRALANIKICDPAIGSGAFPVGMMQEIVKVRGVLTTYFSPLSENEGRSAYSFKRHAIQTSIYGVDIDPGAVDIAKLRLWLSLVVDEEDYTRIKPLPNLDYKIVCGNSLLSVEKNLFNHQIFAELEQRKQEYFEETNPDRKTELRNTIQGLIKTIANQDETFDFEVYFSEVFHQNGGFDVVIANPPYVGQDGNREKFQKIRQGNLKNFYKRNMDIFYFFFHLALNLSKHLGHTTFITTNYYLTADGALLLRKDLKDRSEILRLVDFNELKIFDSARGQHNIISILKKTQRAFSDVDIISTQRSGNADGILLDRMLSKVDEKTSYFSKKQSDLYEGKNFYIRILDGVFNTQNKSEDNLLQTNILNKIKRGNPLLEDVCQISQGMQTGADKVTKSHVDRGLIGKQNINSGIYVLSNSEVLSLNLPANERAIFKPFFKNSDIKQYYCSLKPNKFVIYATRDLDIEDYPITFSHLSKFRSIIEARSSDRGEIQAALAMGKWWVVFSAREKTTFTGEKIICPYRSGINRFAYNKVDWYAVSDVYYIKNKNKNKELSLKYILALLNSSLYYYWLYFRGKRKGDILELFYTPLCQIPIKEITKPEEDDFVEIVDKILKVTESSDFLKSLEKIKLVESYQAQINQMVFDLFQLSDEEIAVVKARARDENYA